MSGRIARRNLFIADEAEEEEDEEMEEVNDDGNNEVEDEDDEVGDEEDGENAANSDDEFQAPPRQRARPRPSEHQPASLRAQQQRGTGYTEMFSLVQRVANHGAKITDLLEKTGQIDQCQRLDRVMMRLAEFDKGLDRDRRAVDETKRQHGGDEADKPVLDKYFKKIRDELQIPNPGKCQAEIQQVRTRIGTIREIAERQRVAELEAATGGGAGADDDSIEMEMISAHMSDKDPYTKRRIQEPVKNPICGHIYDKESIQEYINFQRGRRQLYQCPVELCKNRKLLDMKQLVPYPEFFQLIRRGRSRSRSRSCGPGSSRRRSRTPDVGTN